MCEAAKSDTCENKNLNTLNQVNQQSNLIEVAKEVEVYCLNEKRPYICPFDDCNKSYTLLSHLRRHEDAHENGYGYTCDEKNCNQIFKTKVTLKKHVDNIHLKKKPKKYKCSFCDQEFNKHSWLTSHEYKHTGIRPYLCPTEGCEKRFLVPSKLRRHLKIHEGYTCSKENCDQKFSKWTLYLKHLKTSHPKIYKCNSCEKAFKTSYNLKAHLQVHNLDRDAFLCPKPNCSRFYFQKKNLRHHLKTYHEKRPYICTKEHCYKAFKSEKDLNTHASQHDPNKRIRKKKKSNPKPSFAAKLAGCLPKKAVKDKVGFTETVEKSLVNSEELETEHEASLEGNCQLVTDSNNTDNHHLSTRSTDSVQNGLSKQETMLERKSYQIETIVFISA